jgi:hypothetical protein
MKDVVGKVLGPEVRSLANTLEQCSDSSSTYLSSTRVQYSSSIDLHVLVEYLASTWISYPCQDLAVRVICFISPLIPLLFHITTSVALLLSKMASQSSSASALSSLVPPSIVNNAPDYYIWKGHRFKLSTRQPGESVPRGRSKTSRIW